VKNKSDTHNYIDVLVRWDDSVMEPGMANPTKERLKRKDYNPQRHYHGGWRVDLSYLRNIEYIKSIKNGINIDDCYCYISLT
jgi:hypothetical protein